MKKIIKLYVLLVLFGTLQAELIILKRENGRFVPLTAADNIRYQQKIFETVMKYQWPTCLVDTSSLTKEELAEYFAPNKPYGEERLVQKKLSEAIDPAEIDLQVMFVPTTVFELFAMKHDQLLLPKGEVIVDGACLDAPDKDQAIAMLKKEFNQANNKINNLSVDGESCYGLANRMLAETILTQYPELAQASDATQLSNAFQKHATQMAISYKNALRNAGLSPNKFEEAVTVTIAQEYRARDQNKALLLRGSSFVDRTYNDNFSIKVIGSTIKGNVKGYNLPENYYSVSFANSLFSCAFYDKGACTYDYFSRTRNRLGNAELNLYSVFVDKMKHITAKEPLYFIASLASLAAATAIGQIVHSRTRVAVHKTGVFVSELRLSGGGVKDPASILLFKGDPHKFEEKFLNDLNNNAEVLSLQEVVNFSQLKKNQQEYYKFMRKQRVLMTKLLRRLRRLGLDINIGISNIDILKALLSLDEKKLRLLNKVLQENESKLDPLTLDIFSLSNGQMRSEIIIKRYNNWVQTNVPSNPEQDYLHQNSQIHIFSDAIIDSISHMFDTDGINRTNIKDIFNLLNDINVEKSLDSMKKLINLMKGLAQAKLVGSQNTSQLLRLLEKGMTNNDPAVQSNVLNVINTLVRDKILTIQDMPKILELLKKGMASKNREVAISGVKVIEALVADRILTKDNIFQIWSFLRRTNQGFDPKISIIEMLPELIEAKILTSQEMLIFLEKGMNDSLLRFVTLITIEDLFQKSEPLNLSIKQQLLDLLKISIQEDSTSTLRVIQKLENENKITADEAHSIRNAGGMLARARGKATRAISKVSGLLRGTSVTLMRHVPRDVLPSDQDLQDLARSVGISPEEIGGTENSAESLAKSREQVLLERQRAQERSTFIPDVRQPRTNRFGYEIEPDELPEGTAGSGARAIPKIGRINTAQALSVQPDFMNRVQQPSSVRNYSSMPSIAAMNAQRSLAAQRQLASEQMSVRRLAEAAKRKAPDAVRAGFRGIAK